MRTYVLKSVICWILIIIFLKYNEFFSVRTNAITFDSTRICISYIIWPTIEICAKGLLSENRINSKKCKKGNLKIIIIITNLLKLLFRFSLPHPDHQCDSTTTGIIIIIIFIFNAHFYTIEKYIYSLLNCESENIRIHRENKYWFWSWRAWKCIMKVFLNPVGSRGFLSSNPDPVFY